MRKHSQCHDLCQLVEHKGYADCKYAGFCELLENGDLEVDSVSIEESEGEENRYLDGQNARENNRGYR